MSIKQFVKTISIILLCVNSSLLRAQTTEVPGVVVHHQPASTKTYLGSPSLCILPNGNYVASHDHFGPGSTEHTRALTYIYTSSDKGKSWRKVSEINGQFWGKLFVHKDALYIMGPWKHHGNFVICKSTDWGITWTMPENRATGLLFEGEYHTAPMPIIEHNGRLWRAIENAKSDTKAWGKRYSAMVISASVDSDLLNANSWRPTNSLPYDSTYLNGNFGGWLEGNVVVKPNGEIVDILRVATSEKGREVAAFVDISEDGRKASFNPSSGFKEFRGGAKKFVILYDETTQRYWTLSNMIKKEFNDLWASGVRNTLVLASSPDLINWTAHKVLLSHPDVKNHGFQYADWHFDGKDIIFLSRTAFDEDAGQANNNHDSNYITFHRIKNYKKNLKKVIEL